MLPVSYPNCNSHLSSELTENSLLT